MQRNQAARRWGLERCLWSSMKRSSFPVLGFSGGVKSEFARAKKTGPGEKVPKNCNWEIKSWRPVIILLKTGSQSGNLGCLRSSTGFRRPPNCPSSPVSRIEGATHLTDPLTWSRKAMAIMAITLHWPVSGPDGSQGDARSVA